MIAALWCWFWHEKFRRVTQQSSDGKVVLRYCSRCGEWR